MSIQTIVGLKETKNANISLYPNPAKNEITINLANSLNNSMVCSMIDVLGKEVASASIEKGTSSFKLNIESLEKGVYFVNLMDGNTVITKKIIKE